MFDKSLYGPVLVPVVTPFGDDDAVDLTRLAALVDYLVVENKADSLIVSGTTGEFHSQTFTERVSTFSTVFEAAAGRRPVIAGIGAASTSETIALGREARNIGLSTVMVVTPYYTKPTQSEIYAHYVKVAEALPELDIMLYNIPIFTGVNIDPATVAKLSEIETIVAIKEEAELNPKQITQYLNATAEDFIIYNGDDTMILEAFIQGGDRIGGVVSGAAHVVGPYIRTMIETLRSGDVLAAAAYQRKLYPLLKIMGQSGRTNPVSLWKEALRLVGVDAGVPRSPLSAGTPEEIERVRGELVRFGAL